ncbi:MAG: radical SAM protein [Proteobacteria bacterium]|nr:radical SAM protein [Pseudomonadota bacterium]
MKVLLLNPPADRPVLRDYYCSTRPKTSYFWHPIDLLALVARLRDEADLLVLDCIGGSVDVDEACARIAAFAPDVVFGLVSALTTAADLAFLRELADAGARIVVGGEVALDPAFDFAAHPFVAGLVLDFTAPEAAAFLLGDAPEGRIRTADVEPAAPPRGTTFALGGPLAHEALDGRYALPLWPRGFRSLLTDFGCTFACAFCNSGRHSIGHKVRDVAEVGADIDHLAALGTRHLYLRNMTFGGVPDHTHAVLDRLARYRFSLRGFVRADQVDEAMASAMAAGGLRLAQLGLEAPTEALREGLGKRMKDASVARAALLLRDRGIAVGAHFTIGGTGQGADAADACASYASALGAAYCSINVLQQRHGCAAIDAPTDAARADLDDDARRAMRRYNLRGPARLAQAALRRRWGTSPPSPV